jgi:hypothetical protein
VTDQDINDLLKVFDNPCHCYPLNVVEAIRLLVKQRDETRQLYCIEMSRQSLDPKRYTPERCAKQRGWDCFDAKEAKP